jgi:hypothetical protein
VAVAGTLLDEAMPRWDFDEVHETRVAAPPPVVLDAARAVTTREVRPLAPLIALRLIPATVRHPRAMGGRLLAGLIGRGSRPVIEELLEFGFIELGARDEEVVLGAVGRFWRPWGAEPIPIAGPDAFLAFSEPGYAKGAMNLFVAADGDGSHLRTETRVAATSPDARGAFARYWRLILPGSGLIRRSMLAAIRRRAERTATARPGNG